MNDLLSVDQYLQRILGAVAPGPSRPVPLAEAYGLAPVEDLWAAMDLPPFRSSAMDGFAVRAADLEQATKQRPVYLQRAGSVSMGSGAPPVNPGQAMGVPTGGMVPEGADAVVPIEICTQTDARVGFCAPVLPGRNIRPSGQDAGAGGLLVAAGRRLGAVEIGLLASAGIATVEVRPAPRVGILSTGDELIPPASVLGPGQIHDSNSYMLSAAVRFTGCSPVDLGHVPDDPAALVDRLRRARADVDLVVCSGGVSAGADDPVKRAFSAGVDVCCVSVAMQPGRPQAFGIWQGKPFFGLPGNPAAALVSFHVFVAPALARMGGARAGGSLIAAVLGAGVAAHRDRCRFVPALLAHRGGALVATPLAEGGSNLLTPWAAADALLEVPAGPSPAPGDGCRVILLRPLNA